MGFKFWSSWVPEGRKLKSQYYGGFFIIMLKVDLQISQIVERHFCEKSGFIFILFRINFAGISYINLKAISIFW